MDLFQEIASFLSSSRLIALQVLAQKSSAAMNTALACFASDAQAIGRLGDGALLHVTQQVVVVIAATRPGVGHGGVGVNLTRAPPVAASPRLISSAPITVRVS